MQPDATTKRMRVTIVKEINVSINNDRLTPEALTEFSQVVFQTDDPDAMFELAAQQIARFEPSFIEGIGPCRSTYGKETAVVRYEELSEDVEVEEVDDAR